MGKLSTKRIEAIKKPGRYPDGGNLYLQVGPKGTKSWAFLFMLRGRARQMGLGRADLNSNPKHRVGLNLAEARDKAYECRRLVLQGVDPIEHRNASRPPESGLTFKECAERLSLRWKPAGEATSMCPSGAIHWRRSPTRFSATVSFKRSTQDSCVRCLSGSCRSIKASQRKATGNSGRSSQRPRHVSDSG